MIMLVDSHCHLDMLDLTPYGGDLSKVIKEAEDIGVEHFLCIAVQLDKIPQLIAIAEQFPNVNLSVGVHPTDEPGETVITEADLLKYAVHPKVVAIGETGLDYYRLEDETAEKVIALQQERFRTHIRVSKQLQKPLIIHTRAAKEDTLRILREEKAETIGGVLHCFTEDLDMALQGIELGFYVSFSGIITFKNAVALQETAKALPLDRILVETDSPYLAPVPFRGKSNVPAYVRYTAEYLAQLRGITFAEVAKQTTKNFYQLFKIT
jgi:TatD DNase family protein